MVLQLIDSTIVFCRKAGKAIAHDFLLLPNLSNYLANRFIISIYYKQFTVFATLILYFTKIKKTCRRKCTYMYYNTTLSIYMLTVTGKFLDNFHVCHIN